MERLGPRKSNVCEMRLDSLVIIMPAAVFWLMAERLLAEEYSSLYIFHLRGNARTSGELRRKEKDNVFGMGTRTPIAISLFVKNPKAKEHGKIYFHDIGDYLSQKEKLDIVRNFKSIEGITEQKAWKSIVPDQYNDWINHRDESFDHFIDMGDKKDKNSITIFENYSNGC